MKTWITTTAAVACLLGSAAVWSQTPAVAPPPPSKDALVARVLQLWHPEDLAVRMVQQPALDAAQQARALLQTRVSKERRDAVMQDIAGDVKAFVAEAAPLARAAAQRLTPVTLGPLLQQRFNEAELAQLVAILESPVRAKFEQMVPEFQRALGEALSQQTRAQIDPRLAQLSQSIAERLRGAATP